MAVTTTPATPSAEEARQLHQREAVLLAWRKEFPILEHTTYLISNSLGAMPRAAEEGLQEYAESWRTRGIRAWEDAWWMLAAEVGDQIGALLNAAPGSVSCHQNVTQCQATVASCLDFTGKRNKVVYSDLNFPSVMYLWEAQRHYGARIHMVETDGIHVPLDRMLDAIDEHTAIVPISHVIFRSSYLQDAKAIVEKAHRVGALVLLDCFQATGCVPVDVKDLGVDFATGGVLKWLCGGPGTAYLYVRPDLAPTLHPRFTGWIASQDPFAFQVGEIQRTNTQYRFMNGTPNIPALYAARPGLSIIQAAAVENIRLKSKRQVAKIIAMARERGWRVNTPEDPERRGGTVSLDLPNGKEICAALIDREILVDYRPQAGIRMAPHFYTTDDEIDRAIAALDELVPSR